jgi:hypothetical protein
MAQTAPCDEEAMRRAISGALVQQEQNRNCFGTASPTTAPAP